MLSPITKKSTSVDADVSALYIPKSKRMMGSPAM